MSSDHSKRGRRFVSILDPDSGRVTLLEPWEHAILVLCDGTRAAPEIAALLYEGVEGEPVTLDGVRRCLKFFEREALIEALGLRRPEAEPPAGPRTLANLQLAYREWHKDPVKTGQILAGDGSPFILVDGVAPVGLSPTVALPEDEAAPPVAVGTKLVMGSEDGALAGGDRPLRSVFDRSEDARTEIGALDEAPRGPRTGGSASAAPEDADDDVLEIEELEELELGDVADLLAAVDSDFDELEGADEPALPPVRATGGEAELPPVREAQPATAELVVNPSVNETTQRFTPREAALTPTLVGVPADDGEGPMIISPPRSPSAARKVERVGAVIGPSPSEVRRNVAGAGPRPRGSSDIAEGAVVEDTQRFDLPTESSFAAHHPTAVDSRPPARHASVPKTSREETTNRSAAHLPKRARAVFERLWALGVEARAVSEETLDAHDRRRRGKEAGEFQAGLERLTAGDLELALVHFETLRKRLPASTRVRAFADTIRVALDEGVAAGPDTELLLSRFSDAVDDAIAAGQCPRCLCGLEPGSDACHACGLSTGRGRAAHSAG